MNASLIREKLLSNWKEKLCCFIFAIAIYAVYWTQRFGTDDRNVKLEVKSEGNLTVKSGYPYPTNVVVTVRTDREKLDRISGSDLTAYINLDYYSEAGTYDFPVYVEPKQPSKFLDIYPLELDPQPKTIRLEVEEETVRYIPVSATISGKPAYGYEQGAISINPTSVRMKGPRSSLVGITEVQTEQVDLDGATESLSTEVGFQNMSKLVHVDTDEYDQKVTVSVVITPMVGKKTIQGIEISYENVNPGLEILHKNYKLDIIAEGKQLDLDRLKASSFSAAADCSLATEPGEKTVPVFVFGPNNVKIEQSIDSITVTARWKPEEDVMEELPSPNYGNYYQ